VQEQLVGGRGALLVEGFLPCHSIPQMLIRGDDMGWVLHLPWHLRPLVVVVVVVVAHGSGTWFG